MTPTQTASFTDARGHVHAWAQPPRRIVSLVPSLTELLAALGLDDEVVGLTRFCVHPDGWKQTKEIVGGTKQVNQGRIEALVPDLILANLEENTREMVEALDELAPTYVTNVRTVPEALALIRTLGHLVHRAAPATALTRAIDAAFSALPAFRPLRAAYLIWQKPYMTIGHDTFIHDVMQRAGLVNAFGDQPRYPEITLETLAAAHLDVVLLSSEPFPFQEKHRAALRAALPQVAVHLADGELFSWYGSRLLKTPPYLKQLRMMLEASLEQPAASADAP